MSAGVSDVNDVGETSPAKGRARPKWSGGTLSGLACKCIENEKTDFLLKEDRIVCASCGREVLCSPPVRGVYEATCGCCISTDIKTTFVLDAKGNYTCTWCGGSR